MSNHRISAEQKAFYKKNGYLLDLPPIYDSAEMAAMNAELPHLLALLRPGGPLKISANGTRPVAIFMIL